MTTLLEDDHTQDIADDLHWTLDFSDEQSTNGATVAFATVSSTDPVTATLVGTTSTTVTLHLIANGITAPNEARVKVLVTLSTGEKLTKYLKVQFVDGSTN